MFSPSIALQVSGGKKPLLSGTNTRIAYNVWGTAAACRVLSVQFARCVPRRFSRTSKKKGTFWHSIKNQFVQFSRLCLQMRQNRPGGTPLYKPYMYVTPQRVGFLRRFGLNERL